MGGRWFAGGSGAGAGRGGAPGRRTRVRFVVLFVVVGSFVLAACGKGSEPGATLATQGPPDSWAPMSTSPLGARWGTSAVWTGSKVLIWGGRGLNQERLGDGAAYDPAADSWTTMAKASFESAGPQEAIWTGTAVLTWEGGYEGRGYEGLPLGAYAYDPARDRWTARAKGPNFERADATTLWTGKTMLVWGGLGGVAYDPAADRWAPLAKAPPGLGSGGHSAVWSGTRMLVWGGATDSSAGRVDTPAAEGAAYDPGTDTWAPMAKGPLSPRGYAQAVWTGTRMVIWGGFGLKNNELPGDGAAYDPATDRWTAIDKGPLSPRGGAAAVWTGREMLVWSGNSPEGGPGDGAAYDPATDGWRPLPEVALAPRGLAAITWTGEEMVIWGGLGGPNVSPIHLADGARYRP